MCQGDTAPLLAAAAAAVRVTQTKLKSFLLCCAALKVFSRSPRAFPRMATGQPAAGHSFAGLSAIDKLW